MPNDKVQADALATAMRDRGCKRVAAVHDGEVYGKGVGTLMRRSVARLGMKVAAHQADQPQHARASARSGADCVAYTGITANGAVRHVPRRASRKAQLFASDGVAESGFTRRVCRLGRQAHDGHGLHARPGRLPRPAPRSSAPATRTRSTATRR